MSLQTDYKKIRSLQQEIDKINAHGRKNYQGNGGRAGFIA